MAELAIKGHPTRGGEVIKLLEMLGGVNKHKIDAIRQNYVYFIDMDNIIRLLQINQLLPEKDSVYSLEEFEEKFPYKVGDKVTTIYGKEGIVSKLIWSQRDECVRYELEADLDSLYFENELQPYKEDTVEEDEENFAECIEKTIQVCLFGEEGSTKEEKTFPPYMDYDITMTNEEAERNRIKIPEIPQSINLSQSNVNEIEVVLGDYEFILKDGKTYFVKKKPKCPKTYEECCNILGIEDRENGYCGYKYELFGEFQKLYICRDAYWKIAGEELGLGKPWKFENPSENWVFTIECAAGCIYKHARMNILYNFILAFPTAEMRDAFYENFEEVIEKCKELL